MGLVALGNLVQPCDMAWRIAAAFHAHHDVGSATAQAPVATGGCMLDAAAAGVPPAAVRPTACRQQHGTCNVQLTLLIIHQLADVFVLSSQGLYAAGLCLVLVDDQTTTMSATCNARALLAEAPCAGRGLCACFCCGS